MDVDDSHWTPNLFAALGVVRADDTGTSQGNAKSGRPMIAAANRVDIGRATEFAATDDDRVLEKIDDECGEIRIQNVDQSPLKFVVIDVGVPTVQRELDAADAHTE